MNKAAIDETRGRRGMSIRDTLIAVKEVIAEPSQWTQGQYCDGEHVSESTCFCLSGAFLVVHYSMSPPGNVFLHDDVEKAELFLAKFIKTETRHKYHGVISFNDSSDQTHEAVIAMLDKAIEAAPT